MTQEPDRRDEAWTRLPREVLDSPGLRARIEEARRRIADGGALPGKNAEQLERLAEERRASVDP